MNMITVVEDRQGLRLLDQKFAEWLVANFGRHLPASEQNTLASIACAVSHAVFLKHTCLDLEKIEALHEPLLAGLMQGITLAQVVALLADPKNSIPPLVCSADGKKIWLQKYALFENLSAECLQKMAAESDKEIPLDAATLHRNISAEQQAALVMALSRGLAVITGGPGTGKTFTVGQIISQLLQQKPDCIIELAAPTGKAGQRMTESIKNALQVMPARPLEARTLHSLLGIGYASPKPRYHRNRPLALDVLIVDEASMIDLPMMYRLLDALPENAKLILLGDKDQLASVEAGSVLAELYLGKALHECVVNISKSHRFDGGSEIGKMARWINGEVAEKPDFNGSHVRVHIGANANIWQPRWLELAVAGYSRLHNSIRLPATVADVLLRQKDFQLLCALRKGPYGVEGINAITEKALGKNSHEWYAGKPLIILQNDRSRKLFNGDVGLVLPLAADNKTLDPDSSNLKACFLTGEVDDEGGPAFRAISKTQIPPHETCYALTVHKSQGSEYQHVLVVLPDNADDVQNNPVLTKELAYTAVTRAKSEVDMYAGNHVLEIMAGRATVRMSGLAAILDGQQG